MADDDIHSRRKPRRGGAPVPPTIDLEAQAVPAGPSERELEEAVAAMDQQPAEPEPGHTVEETAETPAPEGRPEVAEPTELATPPAADAPEGPVPAPEAAPAEPELASSSAAPRRDEPQAPRLDLFEEPPRERSRTLPLLAAGLVGGLVGAAAVLALASAFGLFNRGDDTALVSRIVSLEQQTASTQETLTRALGRLDAAEAAAKGAGENAQNALALAQEARSAAGAAQAQPAAPDDKRLDELAASLASVSSVSTNLGQQVVAAANTATQAEAAADAVGKRVDALERAASAGNPDKAAAYTVALSQLGEALRAGRPFEAELKAAAALGPQPDALKPLEPLAAKGTPSVGALAASFDAARPAILAALAPKREEPVQPAETGVMDRLWSSFSSVVTVTREDAPAAVDAAGPVNAVSEALHAGDLPAAIAAFKALPQPAQAAGASWLAEAEASANAGALVRAQSAAALQTLTAK